MADSAERNRNAHLRTAHDLASDRRRYGQWLIATAVVTVATSEGLAANAANNFKSTGGTSLSAAAAWSGGTVPTASQDAVFTISAPTGNFTLSGASLMIGSLSILNTGTISITNQADAVSGADSSITLGGPSNGGNGVSGSVASDVIYLGGSTSALNLNGGTRALNLVLGQSASINAAAIGTSLNIGTTGAASTFDNGGYLLTVAGAGTTTLGSTNGDGIILIGSGGLTKTSAGALTLNGPHAYTGVTTVTTGTLNVGTLANGGANSSIGAAGIAASNLLLANGTTLNYTGPAADTNRLFTIDGVTSNATATITANGSGAVRFTNFGAIGYGLNNQTRTLTLGGTNTGANTLAALVADNGAGVVTLSKTGAGTWMLPTANDYTGGTKITGGGFLAIGNDRSLGTGTITFTNSGGLRSTDANTRTISNPVATATITSLTVTFGSATETTGDLIFSSDTVASFAGGSSRTLAVNNAATTFTSGIAGNANLTLTKNGPGTLIINGPSSFGSSATTALSIAPNSGAVRLGHNTAAGPGLIRIDGTGAETGTLQFAGGITVANAISLTNGRNDPFDASAPGVAHLQNVSGDNTVSASGFAIPSTGAGVLFRSDSGTLTLAGSLAGINGGSVARDYHLYGSGNGVVSGAIADGVATASPPSTGHTRVVKDGPGTWTLTGANVYAGTTLIRGGTLRADRARAGTATATTSSATGTSQVAIANGGTLAGIGGTAGVVVQPGGTITAGTGATASDTLGTLTTTSQTWEGGGVYAFKIAATTNADNAAGQTAGMGVYWDKLVMSSLTLQTSATSSVPFIIKLVGLNDGLQFKTGSKFQIAQINSAVSTVAADLTTRVRVDAFDLGLPDTLFNVSALSTGSSSSGLFLNFTGITIVATPEPTTALLAGLGGSVLLGRRGRRAMRGPRAGDARAT